ncbi:type I secretion system permease/ATPase [Alysiella filiformis]|uniref:Cyclolysin secretion/processing ATP-binding protein CyaB n=1 Tax=Alysiella filiformis DSM 16848 TaxID=1120981 RepID=A0A286EE85_9NEIS|nr:type I secretion system permease/ATPase [Alysiella filiformis]QMT30940.1 type I secretion system permease/ATPase [Alysiella filiformis]UBQ56072.1 type I secretion system permease/ATPase [Alysiella filiformis DSM 16848]SOD69179.1 ATP-binding cassette, subfamily C, LapB [Alysiella filiformis DSM 16848]
MKSIIEHLSIATQHYGHPIAEAALSAQVLRDKNLSVNYASLSEVLASHGFENSLSKRDLLDIPTLAVPVVAILRDEQAAVITQIKGAGRNRVYQLRQSGNVVQEISHADLSELYLGYCWFIKPKIAADGRSDLPEYTLPKAWFWKVIGRFRRYYVQVILATIIINFLALVSSLYVMQVYDRVIPNKTYETLAALSIGVVIAVVFELITKLIRGHLTDIAGKKADLIISSALFRRVMALRLAEKPTSAGSYANNLRDFEAVREFMTSASLLALVDLPFLLLFVGVIAMLGGKLAFVPLTVIAIVVVVSLVAQRPLSRYINQSMKESSQRQGLAVEAIEGIETLKVNNATNWAQQKWDFYTAETAAASIKVKDTSNFIVNFAVAMQQLNTVGLVVVGTFLIHSTNPSDQITMGALIASVILSGRALAPLGQVAGLATRYQSAKHALDGINKIVERPIERMPDRQYITLDNVSGSLQFNNSAFTYQKDSPVAVRGVNLRIQAGEKVAILGSIGSGKSTLLKLAAGLYEPQQGNVTLDNVDLRQLDPNFLRNQVVLLNQSPRLFLGTLRENMDLARTDGYSSSDQDLLNALARFGLDKIIQNHPKGLDMPLGEDGLGLSGGQKQIIALARLTLKQPRVVLLDEPTASLDPSTEMLALKSLGAWARDKTLIVVTHRPQVLNMVDRIIIMENGTIGMDGKRDEVLRQLVENEKAQAR